LSCASSATKRKADEVHYFFPPPTTSSITFTRVDLAQTLPIFPQNKPYGVQSDAMAVFPGAFRSLADPALSHHGATRASSFGA
jgi:hypothetical protein